MKNKQKKQKKLLSGGVLLSCLGDFRVKHDGVL